MWLNLIVVLAFVAASVAGDRYSDYSAAKMPQYGGGDYDAPRDSVASAVLESEDYQGHSPDASASPDYKYEGELKEKQIKSSLKGVESEDLWQRPVRQQRSRLLIDNDDYIEIDKLSPEDVIPKLKSRYRYAKHRPRHKSWKSDRDVRINNNNRDENEEVNDTESEEFRDKVDFRRNKNKNLEDNVNYEHKVTTNKIIRRKPRRLTAGLRTRRPVHDIEEDIDDILPDRRLKEDEASDDDFSFDAPSRNRLGNNRYRPSDDEDIVVKLHKNKLKQGSYSEYNDYYDMKRVNNIKNKLPTLLQRTKGVDETWAPSMANVAERELTALLSAHHHLKDVASSTSYSPASNIRTLETLSAKALDPRVRREWDAFIAANNSQNCVFSLSIAFLALLYNLQR